MKRTKKIQQMITKIQKLLTLAADPSNQSEAALAAEKARAIAFQYNLSIEQIQEDIGGARGRYQKQDVLLSEKTYEWELHLHNMVAKHFFCELIVYTGTTAYALIGRPHNIVIARQLISYLRTALLRLADQAYLPHPTDRTWKKTFYTTFCLAAIQIIQIRLQEKRREEEEQAAKAHGSLIEIMQTELRSAAEELVGGPVTREKGPNIIDEAAKAQRRGDRSFDSFIHIIEAAKAGAQAGLNLPLEPRRLPERRSG